MKRILILTLAFALTICFMPAGFNNNSYAASALKISNSKLTLALGMTKALKIKGTAKTVKWKSSNSSVVAVSIKGIVVAKKKGSATITGKVNGKTYKCKTTVKNIKPKNAFVNTKRIKLTAGDKTVISSISKKHIYVSLSPKISNKQYNLKSSNGKIAKITKQNSTTYTIKGVKAGKTTLILTVKSTKIKKKVKVIVSNPASEIQANDNVKEIDPDSSKGESEIKNINLKTEDMSFTSKNTANSPTTEVKWVMDESNPIYKYILNGTYKKGDIIYIPECNEFPSGLALKYISHNDTDYPSGDSYDPKENEVIIAEEPTFNELFKEPLNLETTDNKTAKQVSCYVLGDDQFNQVSGMSTNKATSRKVSGENKVYKKGFQWKLINKGLQPSFNGSNSISIGCSDIVMYDADGDGTTTNDQIMLDGEFGMNNINPTVAFKTSKDKIPEQVKLKVSYNDDRHIKVTLDKNSINNENLSELIKTANAGFKNTASGCFINGHSGVDMDNTLVLAAWDYVPASKITWAHGIWLYSIRC